MMSPENAGELARMLTDGRWTHDFPIDAKHAQSIGLQVSTDLPDLVRRLMRLYPQPRGRRPSVEYIPDPYQAPRSAERRRRPGSRARQ
jgi:ClpP class serine protease